MRLFLASQSPRRLALLQQLGYDPIGIAPPAGADTEALEHALADENPADYVVRVAQLKLARGLKFLADSVELKATDSDLVLAADTTVALGQEILGKPQSGRQAVSMLEQLSNRTHQVHTAVTCCRFGGRPEHVLVSTAVTFGALSPEWISAYVESGEPLDKAGAYGIQGPAGAMIPRIEGSYSAVMGLPLFETRALLLKVAERVGFEPTVD